MAIQKIGEGGFGRTFSAIDKGSIVESDKCLIKQLYTTSQFGSNSRKATQPINRRGITFVDGPGAINIEEIHRKEISALKKLKHQQIPKYIDQFAQDEYLYIVQEFIEGETLSAELIRCGKFSEEQIVDVLRNILNILEYVHSENIIHRDIKPDNLIRDRHKKLVLVDFGAAKLVAKTNIPQQNNKTIATTVGTLNYMAPEQMKGRATYASDLYSLGITCICLLTGKPLNELSNDASNSWEWKPYCRQINPKLENIIDRLLELGTSRRYQSAKDVIADLEKINNKDIDAEVSPKPVDTEIKSKFDINHIPTWLSSFGNLGVGLAALLTVCISIGILRSCNPSSSDSSKPIASFDSLKESLKKQDWKQADVETSEMLISLAGDVAKSRGVISVSDFNKISCKDLIEIDTIWRNYTNGSQGLSSQQSIYERAGQNWQKAYQEIGWGQIKKGVFKKNVIRVFDLKTRRFQYKVGNEPNYKNPKSGHLPVTINLVQGIEFPQFAKICKF